ncbi:hypothetical protein ACLOJK_036077 [Asimina triloba]
MVRASVTMVINRVITTTLQGTVVPMGSGHDVDPRPQLRRLCEDDVIGLLDSSGELETELLVELVVVYALNESGHINFDGKVGHLAGIPVKGGLGGRGVHKVSEWGDGVGVLSGDQVREGVPGGYARGGNQVIKTPNPPTRTRPAVLLALLLIYTLLVRLSHLFVPRKSCNGDLESAEKAEETTPPSSLSSTNLAMFRTVSLLRTPLRSLSQTHFLFFPSAPSFSHPPNAPSPSKIPTNPFPMIPPSLQNQIFVSPFGSHSSRQRKGDEEWEDDGGGDFILNRDPNSPPKLFVVQPRLRPDTLLQAKLDEALNLANSLEERRDGDFGEELGEKAMPPHLMVQNPAARSPKAHADTYFGPGTVENVKCHLNALESERAWGKPVLDRVGLIIEIFNAHAQTKEAKLQSELAALMYKKTRLVRIRGPGGRLTFGADGEAEVVSARGRGSGGRGFISGAGETELQLQRRRILERRNHLLVQIEEVRRTRALQRAARKRRGDSQGWGLATVAIVGYTNAGKSTLVSALSDCELYSDDRRKVLLSDTVGFISDLPVQLVEAFHATLEELVEADLLVHVLDSSAFNLEEQRSTVIQVLQQIGVPEEKLQNMIEVWNKIDLLEAETITDKSLDQADDVESSSFSEEEREMAVKLPAESTDGDDDTAELSPMIEADDNVQNRSSEHAIMDHEDTPHQLMPGNCIKTSAVMGVGLQELLSLIDEKLNTNRTVKNRNFDFDHKWRPAYPAANEVVVEG